MAVDGVVAARDAAERNTTRSGAHVTGSKCRAAAWSAAMQRKAIRCHSTVPISSLIRAKSSEFSQEVRASSIGLG